MCCALFYPAPAFTIVRIMHTETRTIHDGLSGELRYKRAASQLLVICHGYQSSSAHPALVAMAEGLQAEGYATFMFNFSGKSPLDLKQQTTDIGDITEHFANDYPDITLLAGSFSALSAAIAARREGLTRLITVNGFFGSAQLGLRFKPTFLAFKALSLASPQRRGIWDFYEREYQPEQITIPTLVMHSTADTVVHAAQSLDFFEQLNCPKRFIDLKPADHHLSSGAYTARTVSEIDHWLQP